MAAARWMCFDLALLVQNKTSIESTLCAVHICTRPLWTRARHTPRHRRWRCAWHAHQLLILAIIFLCPRVVQQRVVIREKPLALERAILRVGDQHALHVCTEAVARR